MFNFSSSAAHLVAAALASVAIVPGAQAAGLDLSQYQTSIVASMGHAQSSRQPWGVGEASAAVYNWDRDSIMVIGDEGDMNEYDRDGYKYPGVFDYRLTNSMAAGDPEGITYVGNGQYVVVQERTTNIYKISVDPSKTMDVNNPGVGMEALYYFTAADPAYTYNVSGGPNWGNSGLEGISYDPITGGFFAVKETGPQRVMFIDWDFNTPNSTGTTTDLFDPASLGLQTISDIATLSTVAAFQGEDFADNLLILSQSSEKLFEVTRTGEIVSSLDLSDFFVTDQGPSWNVSVIEGLTVDNDGNIYLVSELGGWSGGNGSAFIKLTRPQDTGAVPEPATWAMMIAGFGLAGTTLRRRAVKVAFA